MHDAGEDEERREVAEPLQHSPRDEQQVPGTRSVRLPVYRDHAEIPSHSSKVPIERPEPAFSHQSSRQQVNVDPANPPSAELAYQDQLQHLFIWDKWRGRKPLQVRDH